MKDHAELLDDDALPLLLREAMLRMIRGNQASLTCRELGVLLVCCSLPGPHPLHELAKRLGVSPKAIGHVSEGLEERDLARRKPNPTDARSNLLIATKAGRAMCRRLVKA